jgi:molecular chaperone GrpE
MKNAETETHKKQNPQEAEPVVPVESTTISPEQLEELKASAAKAADHWERLVRTTADFDNFKKRAAREKQEAIRFANEGLIEKLVPVLDNFDMALTAVQNNSADSSQSLQAGISMIFQQLKGVLTEAGLEEINATGQKFDPN